MTAPWITHSEKMDNGPYARPLDHDQRAQRMNDRKDVTENESTGELGHKRSISGSIMGGFALLKSSVKDVTHRTEGNGDNAESERPGPSIAHAVRQSPGRRRMGSLRKTAILGTGRLLRERRNSIRSTRSTATDAQMGSEADDADAETTPRRFNYESASLNSSADSGWHAGSECSVNDSHSPPSAVYTVNDATPRATEATLMSPDGPYTSTTDDDDGMTFFRPTTASTTTQYTPLQPSLPLSTLHRRRSNRSTIPAIQTPSSLDPSLALAPDPDWDYSETEWWGWIILLGTWVVFIVGMGSCLDIWSWAWDVGETPYAPPELEDDPTLPINGYYPALLVCTGVMAWVWVVVAWVGMKYFRHSKEG